MNMYNNQIERFIQEIKTECGIPELKIASKDVERFIHACGNDIERLRRYIKRRINGEPLEYILGYEEFRGNYFYVDRRAYITDPETSYLVDEVIECAKQMYDELLRPIYVLELGVGCGSLAISVKKELGNVVWVQGLDIDHAALELAHKNCEYHQVEIQLIESDLLRSYPQNMIPDILFGDPPWGDKNSIYDEERPWEHYQAMPPMSVLPIGGITQIHEQILKEVHDRKWTSQIFLNTGTLSETHLQRLGKLVSSYKILRPARDLTIFYVDDLFK